MHAACFVQVQNEMAEFDIALPKDILAQVLQPITQKDRIGSCSLVNTAWNQAVKRTINSLTCELSAGNAAQYESLSRWLSNNSNVSSISHIEVGSKRHNRELDIPDLPNLQLPYPELTCLKTLKLQRCVLRSATTLVTDSSSGGVQVASLAALPALTASHS